MFKRLTSSSDKSEKNQSRKPTSPSVIAQGTHVLGNIVSDGPLDIDGQVEGNVRGDTITLRENGLIRGDVMGDTVFVYGEIDGLVKARNVILYASAVIRGVVMHESLSVEDGATVDGKFKRMESTEANEAGPQRQLNSPTSLSGGDIAGDRSYEDDEPQSEAEIKILENLRLIS
jgi:cytoskeletal protein CcmA (bactofilin family)